MSSWIRSSDPAILTFVPGNHDEVPLHFWWASPLFLQAQAAFQLTYTYNTPPRQRSMQVINE